MEATLERESVGFEQEKSELDRLYTFDHLAEDAAKKLNYGVLQKQLPKLRQETKEKVLLRKATAELDIQPFDHVSVALYQIKAARRATPLRTRICQCLLGASVLSFVFGGLTFIASFLLVIPCWLFASVPDGLPLIWLVSMVVTVLGLSGIVVCEKVKVAYASWVSIPISEYPRPIPEFALQTAVDLQIGRAHV